jgi:hypothetical protein
MSIRFLSHQLETYLTLPFNTNNLYLVLLFTPLSLDLLNSFALPRGLIPFSSFTRPPGSRAPVSDLS